MNNRNIFSVIFVDINDILSGCKTVDEMPCEDDSRDDLFEPKEDIIEILDDSDILDLDDYFAELDHLNESSDDNSIDKSYKQNDIQPEIEGTHEASKSVNQISEPVYETEHAAPLINTSDIDNENNQTKLNDKDREDMTMNDSVIDLTSDSLDNDEIIVTKSINDLIEPAKKSNENTSLRDAGPSNLTHNYTTLEIKEPEDKLTSENSVVNMTDECDTDKLPLPINQQTELQKSFDNVGNDKNNIDEDLTVDTEALNIKSIENPIPSTSRSVHSYPSSYNSNPTNILPLDNKEVGDNTREDHGVPDLADESSDDELLSVIKKRIEAQNYFVKNNVENTTISAETLNIKFIDHPTPSTSKIYSRVEKSKCKFKDDDSIGYHSSDFEFISEDEAEMIGFIVNRRKKQETTRKFSVSNEEYREQKKIYKKMNNDYRMNHYIPQGDDYENMFRIYAPLCAMYMENKAFHVSTMNSEFEGLGFDLNMMQRYDEREDEEHIEAANEAAKLIERMYPRENRRKSRRFL